MQALRYDLSLIYLTWMMKDIMKRILEMVVAMNMILMRSMTLACQGDEYGSPVSLNLISQVGRIPEISVDREGAAGIDSRYQEDDSRQLRCLGH